LVHWGPLSVCLIILIVLLATDKCQGPLRGAVLDHTQDVWFLQAPRPVLYSISITSP